MKPEELLVVDAGNTRVKWAVARSGGWHEPGEAPTPGFTAKRVTALARKYPNRRVVLASVVPKLVPLFAKAFRDRLQVLDAKSSGLVFAYPNPSELGEDRIAAAVALKAERLYPAIIVACGTATAFTVLDGKGRLCGGAIAPGLQTQLNALIGATAQLPKPDLKMPASPLAKSTGDAIRAGVMLGFLGGIREIITQLARALQKGRKPRLILTGGNAAYVAKNLDLPFSLRPLLVLEGLRIIGQQNSHLERK